MTDNKLAVRLRVDEDSVARFKAPRGRFPGGYTRLTLDCTRHDGNTTTYSVDLQAEATFAPRPFDGSRTTLALRPPLVGDPLSFTQNELLDKGFSIRPDPASAPADYARWLRTTTTPMYKLRTAAPDGPIAEGEVPFEKKDAVPIGPTSYKGFAQPWTGALLQGSYDPSIQQAYAYAGTAFYVPPVTPSTGGNTEISIWAGLDNVFQAIVWVPDAPGAQDSIARQCFLCSGGGGNTQGVNFTPAPNDDIWEQVWYCDANGNIDSGGGHACSAITDLTQNVAWLCTKANDPNCVSEDIAPTTLHGGQADFVVEIDTDEISGFGYPDAWPNFNEFTLSTDAIVTQGNSSTGYHVNSWNDPSVEFLADWGSGIPYSVNISMTGANPPAGDFGNLTWNTPVVSDLSNIGTGDFEIGFQFQTDQSSGAYGMIGQRNMCTYGDFWDVRLINGHVAVETDDATLQTHYTMLQSNTMVADGNWHTILIQRSSGSLSISVDGTVDAVGTSSASFGALPQAPAAFANNVYGCVNQGTSIWPQNDFWGFAFVYGPSQL
ncbi:MAG TPA: laminin G domain-containing protein [Polyangiaceae bacterium]|nr:laminin G domain-containing protein [Polyangiaceae bacterium]